MQMLYSMMDAQERVNCGAATQNDAKRQVSAAALGLGLPKNHAAQQSLQAEYQHI